MFRTLLVLIAAVALVLFMNQPKIKDTFTNPSQFDTMQQAAALGWSLYKQGYSAKLSSADKARFERVEKKIQPHVLATLKDLKLAISKLSEADKALLSAFFARASLKFKGLALTFTADDKTALTSLMKDISSNIQFK